MEDKRSLDIATGRQGGSEGRDDERSGTRGGALEGYTLATRRRFKSLPKDAECAHHSGGKRNIYGITEIRRMRAIGRPDRGRGFRKTMVTSRSPCLPWARRGILEGFEVLM